LYQCFVAQTCHFFFLKRSPCVDAVAPVDVDDDDGDDDDAVR